MRRASTIATTMLVVSIGSGVSAQSPGALKVAYDTSTMCAAVAMVDENMPAYNKALNAQRVMAGKLGFKRERSEKDVTDSALGFHYAVVKGDSSVLERGREACRKIGFLS